MLRKLLQEQEKTLFPKRHFAKIPDPFIPAFMRALEQDAEMNGMAETAGNLAQKLANEHINEHIRTENHQLDEIWETGINMGFQKGLVAGHLPYTNRGFLEGYTHGLKEAETFKNPYQLFDTTQKYLKPPIIAAKTALDFTKSDKLTDNKEHRAWRTGTRDTGDKGSHRDLHHWEKVIPAPFAYNETGTRLSLNLNEFAKEKEFFTGYEVYEQVDSIGRNISKKRQVERTKQSVLADALGKNAKIPEKIHEIPPRPEPTLANKLRKQVEEIHEAALPKKPVKALTYAEQVPEPIDLDQIVDSISTPETQKKPQPEDNIASDSSASSSPKQKKRKKSGPKHKGKISDILSAGAAQVVNNPKQLKIQELEDD